MTKRFLPPQPCTWDGVEYRSYTHAAEALGICQPTMRRRILRGYKGDADLRRSKRGIRCQWNGIEYETIKAAADANHISREGMWYRIVVRGYTSDAEMYSVDSVHKIDYAVKST